MNANLIMKKIEMTKSEAKEAGKLNSEKFHELRQYMEMYPGYEVQIKAPAKRKVELRGLTYEYMRTYIQKHDDEKKSKMEQFNTLIAQDKKDGKLVDKGYLVPSHGNTYDFYEVPKSATQSQNSVSDVGLNFEDCPPDDRDVELPGHAVSPEDTEIDNMTNTPDSSGTNKGIESSEGRPTIEVPKVREIVISRPVAQGRERPTYTPPTKGAFGKR